VYGVPVVSGEVSGLVTQAQIGRKMKGSFRSKEIQKICVEGFVSSEYIQTLVV
jgi:hypothetical protein